MRIRIEIQVGNIPGKVNDTSTESQAKFVFDTGNRGENPTKIISELMVALEEAVKSKVLCNFKKGR